MVKDRQILATGYNGAPRGVTHCDKNGCLREKLNVPSGEKHELCRGVHAEQNLVTQAAFHGVKTEGALVYSTDKPCVICAKILINAGVDHIYYGRGYEDEFTDQLLGDSEVTCDKLD